jgi:DNA polymerase
LAPRAVCSLGALATQALLGSGPGAGKDFKELRGKFFQRDGLWVLPTWHPAELLANESLKRQVWDDMKALLKKIS